MIEATVKVSLVGLKKFKGVISEGGPAVTKFLTQWAARYRGFIQLRFSKFSKGGGDWAPLAESTILARTKGRGSGKPAILRDKGFLFAALAPPFTSVPGALEKYDKLSVEVGYGGPGGYPDSSVTVADIASFHQVGGGRLPQRKIIVPPDQTTLDGMAKDAERSLNNDAKEMIG
jgi:hypothetical protein